MSTAYKCDRCGKLYEKSIAKDTKMEVAFVGYQNGLTTKYYDICPDCGESFHNWLKKGEEMNG